MSGDLVHRVKKPAYGGVWEPSGYLYQKNQHALYVDCEGSLVRPIFRLLVLSGADLKWPL